MNVAYWKTRVRDVGATVNTPDDLAQGYEVLAELEAALVAAAYRLRADGCSYADLARPFGFSRQAARKRWPGADAAA